MSYTPSGSTLQLGIFLHHASSKGLPGSGLVEGRDKGQCLKVIVRRKSRHTTPSGLVIPDVGKKHRFTARTYLDLEAQCLAGVEKLLKRSMENRDQLPVPSGGWVVTGRGCAPCESG